VAGWQVLSVVIGGLVLLVVVEMMRRRKLREKYAGIWLVVAISVVVLALLPDTAQVAARLSGVRTASNLVFLLSGVVLALVALQLSVEVGRLEEEVRTSVEEIALLRCELGDANGELAERVAALEHALITGTGRHHAARARLTLRSRG
jgi:hypothetical protein